MNNARHLKKVLLQSISTLAQQKEKFLFNPCVDFTRKRKLSFDELIKFVICMESGTIKDELYKYFGLSGNGITASALIQQRSKIKYEAFKYVFEVFNEKTIQLKSYKGYRLIAVDGSTLPISTDISDSETYSLNRGKNEKGYNAFHLHASYDLLEHTYDDIIIEGEAKYNENAAFIDIVDRYNGKKAILQEGDCAFMRRDHRMWLQKHMKDGASYRSVVLKFTRAFLRDFYQTLDKKNLPDAKRDKTSLRILPHDRPDIQSLFESVIPYFDAGVKPSEELRSMENAVQSANPAADADSSEHLEEKISEAILRTPPEGSTRILSDEIPDTASGNPGRSRTETSALRCLRAASTSTSDGETSSSALFLRGLPAGA